MGDKKGINPKFHNNEIFTELAPSSQVVPTDEYLIGYEFEFYTKLSKDDTAAGLQKALGKKVTVPFETTGFGDKKKKSYTVHSGAHVSGDEFILEPDYSGGPNMRELITGPLGESEARIILIKVLQWIQRNGWTTDRAGIHINISLSPMRLRNRGADITNMNILKMCLSFNEKMIYEKFPGRVGNTYARSVKEIRPANKFMFRETSGALLNKSNYIWPTTKYYGINFLKVENNYLEFRYLGGADYEKKAQKILDCQDIFCKSIKDVVEHPEFTESDTVQLKRLLESHKKIATSFSNVEKFIYNYPEFVVLVDLQSHIDITKTFWSVVREGLYDLIVNAGVEKGYFNYDREVGTFQIKDAVLKSCNNISKFDIVNCKVDGLLDNCSFLHCDIKSSHIEDSEIIGGCSISDSKVKSTPINFSNKLVNCYVENEKDIINGELEDSIIRKGVIGELAIIKNCIKV